jgi:hypothetical protein
MRSYLSAAMAACGMDCRYVDLIVTLLSAYFIVTESTEHRQTCRAPYHDLTHSQEELWTDAVCS